MYKLKKCASEFLAYGCEESSQVLHAVRKHTMWYRTYSCMTVLIQDDQEVSVHLMITIQKSGAQRLFDHPVLTALGVLSAVKNEVIIAVKMWNIVS